MAHKYDGIREQEERKMYQWHELAREKERELARTGGIYHVQHLNTRSR